MKDKLLNYFDKAFCINLEERTDRRKNVETQFNTIGFNDVEFINGIKMEDSGIFRNKGTHGCALVHHKIFKIAKNRNYDNFIIFEDDVIFPENFISKSKLIIDDLKKLNWDIFYFSKPRKGISDIKGNRGEILKEYESGLIKTTGSIGCYAYVVNKKCLDYVIKCTKLKYLKENLPMEIRAIDKAIANLNLNFYACNYDLVLHNWDSKSSIWS